MTARRLLGAMEALLGKEAAAKMASKEAAYEALRLVVAKDDTDRWSRFEGTPVIAQYDAEFDEIRLIHEERDALRTPGKDIGVEGAQKAAESYLALLAENGVIDHRLYEQAAMQLGYRMAGAGAGRPGGEARAYSSATESPSGPDSTASSWPTPVCAWASWPRASLPACASAA